jgi:hypothetical protein
VANVALDDRRYINVKGLHDQIFSIDINDQMVASDIKEAIFKKFGIDNSDGYALFAMNALKGGGKLIHPDY